MSTNQTTTHEIEISAINDIANLKLAILRTELSNSRTLLAHTQASVGLLISAIAVSKLFDSSWIFDVCGMFFLLLAFVMLIRGIVLFRKTKLVITANTIKPVVK
jgi:uncharacterized membrane protein YidH (DUF202 family)